MKIYLKGIPEEINNFLYGVCDGLDVIAINNNSNGDEEEVDEV